MRKNLVNFGAVVILVAGLALGLGGPHTDIQAAATLAPTAPATLGAPLARVLFSDDFTTRANRWNVFDLGKAKIDFDETSSPITLKISAQPANYALWTLPDNELKFDHFDMQGEFTFGKSGGDARAGIMLQYFSENDLTALTVSPKGDVFLGRYYYGLWIDLIPPSKVDLDPTKAITVEAVVLKDHTIRIFVNDQPVGGTALANFKTASFGLFALTGQDGGIEASFQKFVVSDTPQ